MASTKLPTSAFDGQKFIDSRSIEWTYDASTKCWRSGAAVRDIPPVSETTTGLLTPQLKALLDRLPKRGGGFGIVTKPLLSIVPMRRDVAYKGSVRSARKNESGSEIVVDSAFFSTNQFIGKAVFFTTGLLKARAYMLYSNDDDTLYIAGTDASQAKKGDKFEIIDPLYLNQDGAIVGDIKIVSYSLDVACADSKDQPVDGTCVSGGSGTDEEVLGLDIKVSERFLNEFCVQIPGKPGPEGDQGPKGEPGIDGTGDGPKGLKGPDGVDATSVPSTILGVKVQDINDIYDSAVIGLDLDAAKGKLYVVKGKVRTPNQNRPAKQIIASAINRDVKFVDDKYDYEILMPNGDPIGSSDVSILHYPKHAFSSTPGAVEDTEIIVTKLTKLVDAMISHIKQRVQDASDEWDREIKPFIEEKDEMARKELYDLADSVAKCEWGLGMEFCLGISAEQCGPPDAMSPEEQAQQFPTPEILGSDWEGSVSTPLPPTIVPPVPPPVPPTTPGTPSSPGTPSTPYSPSPTDPSGSPTIDLSDRSTRKNLKSGDQAGTYEHSVGEVPGEGGLDPNPDTTSSPEDPRTDTGGGFNPYVPLKLHGSVDLPAGAIVVKYVKGSGRSGSTAHSAAVTLAYKDNAGNQGEVSLQEPDVAVMNNWDQTTFEQSMSEAEPVVIYLEGGGRINAKFELPGSGHHGQVELSAVHVTHPNNLGKAPIPVQMTMQRDKDGNVIDGSGGGGGAADVTLNCGDCPECPPCYDIVASSISPATIPSDAGETVTITGSGFGTSTPTVTIGTTAATIVSHNDTQIVITTPALIENTDYNVIITNNDNGKSETFPNALRADTPSPTFTSIAPGNVPAGAPTPVTINGANFGTGTPVVTINGIAQTIVSNSNNQIIFSSSAAIPIGTYDVIVTNTDTGESSTAVNGITFS